MYTVHISRYHSVCACTRACNTEPCSQFIQYSSTSATITLKSLFSPLLSPMFSFPLSKLLLLLQVDIPVIAATAAFVATEEHLFKSAGFTCILTKPFSTQALAAALNTALGIHLSRGSTLHGGGRAAAATAK